MPSPLLIAQLFGLLGVVFYLLSFQQKRRSGIVFVNIVSRVFYVLQYFLLRAFDGVAMDFLGLISSLCAGFALRLSPRKRFLLFSAVNVSIIVVGLLLYKDVFSLFAIAATVLEGAALWLRREKLIRLLTLVSAPLWLIYNVSNLAFGSALGNALAMVSIVIALARFDLKKQN